MAYVSCMRKNGGEGANNPGQDIVAIAEGRKDPQSVNLPLCFIYTHVHLHEVQWGWTDEPRLLAGSSHSVSFCAFLTARKLLSALFTAQAVGESHPAAMA